MDMKLEIRKANKNEFTSVKEFYHNLIDEIQNAEYKPGWQKGIYPSDDMLTYAISKEELFIGITENKIVGAMAINHSFNEEYTNASWSHKADYSEIMVIHILGVMPSYSGNGYAMQLVEYALEHAKTNAQKAVRLDVLSGNLPAEKLYTKAGFKFVEEMKMYYEDTGWTQFKLYEYPIGKDE